MLFGIANVAPVINGQLDYRHVMSECSECGALSALGVQRERKRERLQLLFSASSSPHRHRKDPDCDGSLSLFSLYTMEGKSLFIPAPPYPPVQHRLF